METVIHEKLECPSWAGADWSLIPEHCQSGVREFIERGLPPGGFLTAVLGGDLGDASARADHINASRLGDYAAFLRMYAPAEAWGTRENFQHWCERGGLAGRAPATDTGKPKIFAFVNGGSPGWYSGAAIAEDGTHLPTGHCSSSPEWSRHDMGADGRSTWKHDIYAAHYPDGFQVEWVEDVKSHPILWPLIERLKAEAAKAEPAAALSPAAASAEN